MEIFVNFWNRKISHFVFYDNFIHTDSENIWFKNKLLPVVIDKWGTSKLLKVDSDPE